MAELDTKTSSNSKSCLNWLPCFSTFRHPRGGSGGWEPAHMHTATALYHGLYCTQLNCTALQFTALQFTALQFTPMHWTAMHWTALHSHLCSILYCHDYGELNGGRFSFSASLWSWVVEYSLLTRKEQKWHFVSWLFQGPGISSTLLHCTNYSALNGYFENQNGWQKFVLVLIGNIDLGSRQLIRRRIFLKPQIYSHYNLSPNIWAV